MALDSESADADGLMQHTRRVVLDGVREAHDLLRRDPIIVPEWLNQKQAAHYVGFSEQFLNEVCADGRGPRFVRAGTRVRYRRSWLDLWMENGAHARAVR